MAQLQTKRLHLIPLNSGDIENFHATNVDEFVRRYLWDDEVIAIESSKELLEEVEKSFHENGWGLWQIHSAVGGDYMGYVGLWSFFDEPQPQLLYALRKESVGFGFAFEASQALIEYTRTDLGYGYLDASMDADNLNSISLAERLGFNFTEKRDIDGQPTLFYRLML